MTGAALRFSLALLLILGILFLAVGIYRRYLSQMMGWPDQRRLIRVLSSCYLGNHQSIALVEVAGEILVVGVSDHGISLLTKVQDRSHLDLPVTPEIPGFPSVLKGLLRRQEQDHQP
ncbi:MAG: flagellar biosynthetic protein FliO [Candidatus Tectomicrobia bacterium]|uniref:Flagellar protein n=1 Tax=Tectimicrobiota bacterium TaxID=2528274 RepID=A0A932FXT9_UNCTE|nr:flagellar biosynthetic protein FliO [Candidatus Tectomicrobia bacterium]